MLNTPCRQAHLESSMDGLSSRSSDVGIAIFMTDRDVAGATDAQIARVHLALEAASRRAASPSGNPDYLRTIYLPSEQRCLCFFAATNAEVVRAINDTAQFPDVRITRALEFSAHRVGEVTGS
jgi:hypothetical protein